MTTSPSDRTALLRWLPGRKPRPRITLTRAEMDQVPYLPQPYRLVRAFVTSPHFDRTRDWDHLVAIVGDEATARRVRDNV